MRSFRTAAATLTFVLGVSLAPLPAHAQGAAVPTGVVVPAGVSTPPVASLKPAMKYLATQQRAISGTNAFREMVPTSSLQDVMIETGEPKGGSLPVTLTVYRFRGDAGAEAAPIDYKVRFDVASDGTIGTMTPDVIEGPMPEPMLRRMVLRDLRGLLFLTGLATHDASAQIVRVSGVSPRKGSQLVDVTFTVDAPKNEPSANASATVETTGSALYDAQHGCYVEHREKEVSTLYVVEDATGDSKTIRMETTRAWKVAVSPR